MDYELRELERKAATGDIAARNLLYYRKLQLGLLNPDNIYITTAPGSDPAIGYHSIYRPEYDRWDPYIEDRFGYILYAERIMLVYAEEIPINFSSAEESLSYDSNLLDVDELFENFGNYDLIYMLESGARVIHNVIPLLELTPRDLFHQYAYNKNQIVEYGLEDPETFEHEKIIIGVKQPGKNFETVEVYNMFENIQVLVANPSLRLDNYLEFYAPGYSPGNIKGFAEPEHLFGDVYMFVNDRPDNEDPNFNIYRAPAMDPNDPRIKAFLDNIEYVDPAIEQMFLPQMQTIFGTAVFAKLQQDWSLVDFDSMRWPWNEIAREEAKEEYPSALELQGLSEEEIEIVQKFISSGRPRM